MVILRKKKKSQPAHCVGTITPNFLEVNDPIRAVVGVVPEFFKSSPVISDKNMPFYRNV